MSPRIYYEKRLFRPTKSHHFRNSLVERNKLKKTAIQGTPKSSLGIKEAA